MLAAIVSPGPALLIAIRTTLGAGRRPGIAMGCGLGLMASAWTLIALLGLDAVFRLFPWVYASAKVIGGSYLIYIACKLWAGAREGIHDRGQATAHAFRQGVLINLLNPKSVLFAAAVLIVVFPVDTSAVENSLIVLNHFLVELLFYTALAIAMSTSAVSDRYLRAKTFLDRTASLILGALGLRILVSR